jgi:hypothetical protein
MLARKKPTFNSFYYHTFGEEEEKALAVSKLQRKQQQITDQGSLTEGKDLVQLISLCLLV